MYVHWQKRLKTRTCPSQVMEVVSIVLISMSGYGMKERKERDREVIQIVFCPQQQRCHKMQGMGCDHFHYCNINISGWRQAWFLGGPGDNRGIVSGVNWTVYRSRLGSREVVYRVRVLVEG